MLTHQHKVAKDFKLLYRHVGKTVCNVAQGQNDARKPLLATNQVYYNHIGH